MWCLCRAQLQNAGLPTLLSGLVCSRQGQAKQARYGAATLAVLPKSCSSSLKISAQGAKTAKNNQGVYKGLCVNLTHNSNTTKVEPHGASAQQTASNTYPYNNALTTLYTGYTSVVHIWHCPVKKSQHSITQAHPQHTDQNNKATLHATGLARLNQLITTCSADCIASSCVLAAHMHTSSHVLHHAAGAVESHTHSMLAATQLVLSCTAQQGPHEVPSMLYKPAGSKGTKGM